MNKLLLVSSEPVVLHLWGTKTTNWYETNCNVKFSPERDNEADTRALALC